MYLRFCLNFSFFNDTPTTEMYTTHNTLSLHDALPISRLLAVAGGGAPGGAVALCELRIPVSLEPAELHALIGRGHVDAADLPDERGLILQTQAEGQVQLPALEIPGVIGGPEHAPRFAVQRPSRRHLLIDVDQ